MRFVTIVKGKTAVSALIGLIGLAPLLIACGGVQEPSEDETAATEPETVTEEPETSSKRTMTKQKTKGSGGSGAPCTVTDSNGPVEGGKIATSGCAKNEICVCQSQAGYSCSGVCQEAASTGVVGVSPE